MTHFAKKAPTKSIPSPLENLLTAADLATVLHLSIRSVWRLRSQGALPAPVQLGPNTIRWRPADVREFLNGLRGRKGRRSSAVRS
jgi:predicted DNA-binding transcriptional regulator AlpA